MATVELKKWTYANGVEWSAFIDVVDDNTTASDYIRGCESNMDCPWWIDRDDYTQYFVAIYGDVYSGAWVHDVI